MAHWERVQVPPAFDGVTRADRQGGSYLRYHPDLLRDVSNDLPSEILEYAAGVTGQLASLGERLRSNPMPILFSTMTRSESISSSWIEGIRENPRSVAVAQIGEEQATHNAASIIRNVAAMRDAITTLGGGAWDGEQILDVHHSLLPRHRRGWRREQVWIGGRTKFDADYAGPPHECVDGYMRDLIDYASGSGDLPIVQAAVVHAQFETIHPFADGNGRVGRALVHGILARAGLIDYGVIALSSAIRDDIGAYIDSLTAYRYDGTARREALARFTEVFLDFVAVAIERAEQFRVAATEVQVAWRTATAGFRSHSSIHRAVDLIAEYPVVSARFLADQLEISTVAAQKLIRNLQEVEILRPASGKYRRSSLYQADAVLRLLEGPRGSSD